MFGGLPPALEEKLAAGTLAARIAVTAGLAVITGVTAAALATDGWAAVVFAITAATGSFGFWNLSGRIVPPTK